VAKIRRRIDLGEAIVPGLGLLFGGAYFLQTTDAPADALYWPILTALVAGPLWLAVVLSFVWVRREESRPRPRLGWLWGPGRRVSFILAASIGYLLVIPWLGFSLTNFVFMLAVFRGLGGRKRWTNTAVALGITVFLHVALVVLMKQSLPQLELGWISL